MILIPLALSFLVYHHASKRWGHGLRAEFAALGSVLASVLTLVWLR